jgi:hypothetical protein
MVGLTFLGCTPAAVEGGRGATGSLPDTGETGGEAEVVPGEAEDPPEPVGLDAPALIDLDCPGEIPVEGKADCVLRIADPDDRVVYEGPAGVGLHGRSSAGFPKKQYAVELRDDAGLDAEVDLFGMGADADWLLNGMYLDRALLRNRFAFDLFREFGGWAPEAVYAEVTLDGAYTGVYLLNERVESCGARLDLPEDDGSAAYFIVRGDESGITSQVRYAGWLPLYPDDAWEAVTAQLSPWESAILTQDSALWEAMDLDGFTDFVLLEEFVKNNDAFYLSDHAWRGEDGLIRFAPWDLDLSLGQPDYNDNTNPASWLAYRPILVSYPAAMSAAKARFPERWAELRAGPLADDAVVARLDALRAELGDAVERNWAVWTMAEVEAYSGFPVYDVATPEEEYARVEAWVLQRLAWMDDNVAAY